MKKVTESLFVGICSRYLEGTLDEVIEGLRALARDDEGVQRDNVRFEPEWEQDSEYRLIMKWDRPETEKEKAKRLKDAAKARKQKVADAEAERQHELAELRRLQTKYGVE